MLFYGLKWNIHNTFKISQVSNPSINLSNYLSCSLFSLYKYVMSSVLCHRTLTADQHVISPAEHLQRPVVILAESLLYSRGHIHQDVCLERCWCVVPPGVLLTVGETAGETGLHSSPLCVIIRTGVTKTLSGSNIETRNKIITLYTWEPVKRMQSWRHAVLNSG